MTRKIMHKAVIILAVVLAFVILAPMSTAQADPARVWQLRGEEAHCSFGFPYWVEGGGVAFVDIPGEYLHGVDNDNYYFGHCHGYVPLGEVWEGKQLFTLGEVCEYIVDGCNGNGSFVMNWSEDFPCYISELGVYTTDGQLRVAPNGNAMLFCRYQYE